MELGGSGVRFGTASLVFLVHRLHLSAPPVQSLFDFLFSSLFGRFVIPAWSAEVSLGNEMLREIVSVLITFAMAEALGSRVMRIPQVARDRQRAAGSNVLECGVDGRNGAVAFGSGGNVKGRFGNGDARF